MRIIGITDYMGEEKYLVKFKKVIKEDEFDAILFSGGITKGEAGLKEYTDAKIYDREPRRDDPSIQDEIESKKKIIKNFFNFFESVDIPFLTIPGRTDSPLSIFEKILDDVKKKNQNIHNLHFKFKTIKDIIFSGCGGLINEENESYFQNLVSFEKVKE
ncbi:MAG: hypothetical protein ACOC85_01435, partial [Thermoplasmatota archaeon]